MGMLLERSESMAALSAHLEAVRSSGQGRLILVGGEAGVGKTSLLRTFCDTQVAAGRVVWGGCEPLRTPRALGPLLDVADVVGGEFADLVARGEKPHDVARALLRALRGRTPTVLVLEDVHWADEGTLDVLTLLARRIASAPALVLASHRDDELDRSEQLRVVVAEVGARSRLKLPPLSLAAVSELAGPRGIDGEELYLRTGGNPFFVVEALAAPGEDIPETVRDAVLARAGGLTIPARRLLEAVAIVPGRVDLWLLQALAGELIDDLEQCLVSGVLRAGPSWVAFRHELARLAIEDSISPERRVALHRQALAALAARDGDPARLVHHADAAGDEESVARWAPLAAERAASSGAHREAAAHYARAATLAHRLALPERAQLLQRLATECWMTDQFEAAIAAQREVLGCRRELGDRLGEGDALRRLARLISFANRFEEAQPLGAAAVELLEQLPAGHELAMAYAMLSEDRFVYHDVEDAVRWGTRAMELAVTLGDTEALVLALESMGAAQFQAGADEGRLKLEHALDLAKENGLDDYVGRAFTLLVRGAIRLRRPASALAYIEAGLEYCDEWGLETWRLYLLAWRARVELSLGRWDEAAASASRALRDSRSSPVVRVYALVALALVRARRGDPDVSGPLEEAHAEVRATGQLEWITLVVAARAEAAWLGGAHSAVNELTDPALALALECREPWSIAELGYWRWKAGIREELPRAAVDDPYSLARAGEGVSAAALWREIGCPYEAALALADADDPAALRQAHDELQALGARAAGAIVARRLRERGVRGIPRGPRPRTRANPAGLTARELEVVALLAEGLRNAEIAERMVVSEKTVGHHVSAVLRKLRVRTRGEASVEASRLGLLGNRD